MQSFHLDTVDSTNDEAKRLFHAGSIQRHACVHAREQTAGKGNHGRTWHSPKDAGIYISVVECAPHEDAPPDTLFTAAAGVACAQALREATGIDVRLKPINDLYVGDRKLGGILVESLIEAGRIRAVITGIGINTHETERRVPSGSAEPVSLQQIVDPLRFGTHESDALIDRLAEGVLDWNRSCWQGDTDKIRGAWNAVSLLGAHLPE